MQRSLVSVLVFLAVIVLVTGGLHYYLYLRLIRAPEISALWTRRAGWIFLALAVILPLGMVITRVVHGALARVVAVVVFEWLGIAFVLFSICIALDLGRLVVHGALALTTGSMDPARRLFLARGSAAIAGCVALGAAGIGAFVALGEVAVRRVGISLRRLPRSLSGFRIAHLTDLHIGELLRAEWLARVVARVNSLDADLVVITGDLVDGPVEELRAAVAPLADLKARHGVFFVTGNHEYYSGVEGWLRELEKLDVRVLRNERVSIGHGTESFDLAGVDDWTARRFGGDHGADLGKALSGRDPRRELVLLAHQPKQVFEAASYGVGLQLSGHTHGGQIFPWGLFVRLDQPVLAGRAVFGPTQIYVSCGTGFWGPPMRVGAPGEIALVELTALGSQVA